MNFNLLMLLTFFLISPIILATTQAIAIRTAIMLKLKLSNLKLLFYCILALNIPFVVISLMVAGEKSFSWATLIYILVTFNLISYSYFILFTMSETARRIKILMGLYSSRIHNINDTAKFYDSDKALDLRLLRMEQLSQIKRNLDGKYILNSLLFYSISILVLFLRSLLGFEANS